LTHPEWLKEGKKDCIAIAGQRCDEILGSHRVDPPLSESQEQDIERILREAREHYRKKGLIKDSEWQEYQREIASPRYPYA
jgi:hypothetical protein